MELIKPGLVKVEKNKPVTDDAWVNELKVNGKTGNYLPSTHNLYLIFTKNPMLNGVLRYDEFKNRIDVTKNSVKITPGRFTDTNEAELLHYLSREFGIEANSRVFSSALITSAKENKFHEVRDFLNGLRGKWDENERLKDFIVNAYSPEKSIDPEYLSLIGTKFLIGAVARPMKPGCKVDNLLILEGPQGIKKSTSINELFYGYVNDMLSHIGDKDSLMALIGQWVIEIAELQGFSQSEDTKLKSFFSTSVDNYRPAYGRSVEAFERQCVFIGTTNQTEYFKDHTGNRRYWPVRCTTVNLQYIKENREQLFAEALHRYENNEKWWPETKRENDLLRVEQDKRLRIDPWQYLIEDFVTKRSFDWIQGNEILIDCIGKSPQTIQKTADQMRIGAIMQSMGWENKLKRIDVPGRERKCQRHVYVRPDDWKFKMITGD